MLGNPGADVGSVCHGCCEMIYVPLYYTRFIKSDISLNSIKKKKLLIWQDLLISVSGVAYVFGITQYITLCPKDVM